MAFIISGAATAASAAAFVAAGGVAAGSAAVTAATVGSIVGGGLAAGAVGAGIGATTAAITGGDVGKGALMGGVGGVVTGGLASGIGAAGGAAVSGTGASTAIGAGSGAAGGAAAAAAGGEDPLTGALYGGAAGGVGGYMKGTDGIAAAAPDASTAGTPPQGISSVPAVPVDNASMQYGSLPNSPSITNAPPVSTLSPVEAASYGNLPQSPIANVNPEMSGLPESYTPVAEPSFGTASSKYLQKGIDLIKEHPAEAMQIGGAGIGMLGSPQQQEEEQRRINTGNYISPNFERYEAVPMYADGGLAGYEPSVTMYGGAADGYAEGGMPQQAPQGPMNPIVARALSEVQQTQQAQPAPIQPMQPMQPASMQPIQPMQPQAQPIAQQGIAPPQGVPPVTPQQGISPPIGITQPQIQPVGMASGGITDGYNLGGYAHGGNPRLLSGPGDGVDDQIPATIGEDGKQPARLANNEFVIPARAVSELGNGSSEAGGKILQQMVDRVQARRAKTVGKGKIAVNSKAVRDLPA